MVCLIAAIGPLLFVGGVVHFLVARAVLAQRVRVTGAIIGWNHSAGGAGVSTPTVRFTTQEGRQVPRSLSASVDGAGTPVSSGGEVPRTPRRRPDRLT